MIRSDYSVRRPRHVRAPRFPAPHLGVPLRRALVAARDAAGAHADGRRRGPARRPAQRRAGLGQEPPGAGVRERGRRARGARPLRRLRRGRAHAVRAVRRGARAHHPRRGPGGAARRVGHLGRRAHASAPRPAGSRRRPADAGRGRRRHRAPPPAHRGDRSARGAQRPPGPARARGRALGRCVDPPAPAPPRPRRRQRAGAPARHLPRHRGRRPGGALADARRPAPLRRRRPAAPRRPLRRRGRRVPAPRRRRRRRPRPARARPSDRRAHGRQRLPGLRAVARPGGDRHRGGRRRDHPAHPAAGGAGDPRERARGRLPAAVAPGARHDRPPRAHGRRRVGVRPRHRAQASGLSEPDLRAALDEAVHSGMIEELPSRRLAYRFTHELVRRALYDRLSGVRRAELHLRVGEALERSEGRSGRALADLAHHFAAAAPLDGPERGIEYNIGAARAAAAAVSFDEAATRLRTALELGIESPARRAEVFLELGTASHRAGDAVDALEAFRETARIARELGDGELLARAAIGYEEACWRPGIADQGAVELLEEATAALGDDNLELRAGLLGGLARGLVFQGEHERGAIVRTNAVALARRLDDRVPLATVLVRSYWSRGTSSLDEILALLTEAVDLGQALGNTEILAEAMAWRVPTFVALGDLDAARLELAAVLATAEQTAQPFMLHVAEHYGSSIALCDGRLEEAEARARHSHEWSRLLTGSDAAGVYGIQMFNIRREQGRLAELAPIIRILAADADRGGPWRPGLVSVLVELGMEAEARRELARVVDEGLDPFRESLWLAALAYLTDACAALGDQATAAIVYPELEPLAGTNVMIGHLVACHGAADRYLGMLAATLGESDRAEEHFERAMELNRRMGAVTWLAHTAYEYGRLLLARGNGERDRADTLLGEAAELAERIGMPALLGRLRALGSAVPTKRHPDELSAREVEILCLVARGMSNREIGATLFISEHTAANHIRSILRKTRCANRTEAASYAHRHGLVGA